MRITALTKFPTKTAKVSTLHVAAADTCETNRFTEDGECCDLCPLGFGVTVECGKTNTQCKACQEGLTFSTLPGTPCSPCSLCPQGIQVTSLCMATQDTQCNCGDGFFLNVVNGSDPLCAPCSSCGKGLGVEWECGPRWDTKCKACPAGTYSEENSQTETCLNCTTCQESEVQIRECTANSDTLCMDKKLMILQRQGTATPKDSSRRGDPMESETSTYPSSPDFIPQEDSGKNIIPVYCSILAAIVIGLLIYVAYKCWTSCKQKQQLAKARASELSCSPEGEKLHSDSGVFLDTHSLQETQQLKGNKLESRLYLNVAPQRQEEIEQLLQDTSSGKGWRQLAAQLGYEQDRVDIFGRGEDPVHTLLSDWSAQEGTTVSALYAALSRIERSDVAAALSRPAEASSVV
ncbi:tumor necrosis factor receptor superfamily member 16-like isoform X1 [Polyodon spathula]|uniref:tumor necrosis factor receptor superfamily member 16-like isoform X1 n=1 Tax=Polyodon spathula TaxID=7913 RepID=UPI001B7E89FD|nr:tumor necrosis factor receptor superfamily member 16-like isoform X1 [Polyodon spathula]